MHSSYKIQIIFALIRFVFWFILLFKVATPYLFEEIQDLPKGERLIYSWLGLGGVILASIAFLTILHIYDFFSICLSIVLIPIIRAIWINREIGVFTYLEQFENKIVISQIQLIENFKGIGTTISNLFSKDRKFQFYVDWKGWLLGIAILSAFIIRFYPTMVYAEPFSRQWFFNLDFVKQIRLQNYFNHSASPAGIFAFITLFSMLTQVSPEMLLHFFGALNSVLLMIIVFWSVKKIMGQDKFWVALASTIFFGLIPTILLPVVINNQIEASKIPFALTFAIPTLLLFIKDRNELEKRTMFFVTTGVIATGLADIFVLVVIVFPIICLTFLVQVWKNKTLKNLSDLFRLGVSLILSVTPPLIFVFYKKLNLLDYFQRQLFSVNVFSRLGSLIYPIDTLSQYFLILASALFLIYMGIFLFKRKSVSLNIAMFLLLFIAVSFIYTNYTDIGYTYIDLDQLNPFYALLITGFIGVIFYSITRPIDLLRSDSLQIVRHVLYGILITVMVIGVTHYNKVLTVYKPDSQTLPGSFFKAYYRIIDDYVPHTYTIVAPDIDSTLAMNRHDMMDYDYFLKHYTKQDSTFYTNYDIKNRREEKKRKENLPNLFLFVENKPYDKIQVGILPDQKSKMANMNRWIQKYKKLKHRNITSYFKSQAINVYEIVNNPDQSSINNVLFHSFKERNN